MLTLKGHAYVQRARSGDFEEATNALSEAVALPGVSVEAFFWLGEAQAGARRPRAATAAYQRYMALDPQGIFVARAKRALATRPEPPPGPHLTPQP
jgi:predicted TPR repeat methyltransferase